MKQNVEFNQAVIKFNKRNKINKSSNDEYIKNFRNKFGKFLSQSFLNSNNVIKQEIIKIIKDEYYYYDQENTKKYLIKFCQDLIEHIKEHRNKINDCHFTNILNKDAEKTNSSSILTSLFLTANNIPNNLSSNFSKAVEYYFAKNKEIYGDGYEKYLDEYFRNVLGEKSYLILIDDFSGTGKSISDFIDAIKKYILTLKIEIIIFCIHITEDAEKKIMDTSIKNGIEIKIAFVQKTEKYFINNKELEKKFYEFEKDIVNPGKYYNLGYKNTQALVSNFRNTPNNTLSLFWHENDQWKPLFKRKAKNDFSNKWKEKVHIIRWFLAYKKVPKILVDKIIAIMYVKNHADMKSKFLEIEINRILLYNDNILQECLSQKFLIKQTDFYIITYAGIELLKKYGLEKITLSNILYEFKSNGLHQQKNFDGNK